MSERVMRQEKQIMSNNYRRAAAKKQYKLFMKEVNKRNKQYEIDRKLIIDEMRNAPWVHDFNQLDC